MLSGRLHKTSKLMATFCICVAVVMGVMCQVHAEPHTHAAPAGDHHEDASSLTVHDVICVTAVIPAANMPPVLLFLLLSVSLPMRKPLGSAFELDIPPRHSL